MALVVCQHKKDYNILYEDRGEPTPCRTSTNTLETRFGN
jgi:hypothetical protein